MSLVVYEYVSGLNEPVFGCYLISGFYPKKLRKIKSNCGALNKSISMVKMVGNLHV